MALFLRADLSLPIPTPFIMVMAPALNTRASASVVDDPDLPFWQSREEALGTPHPLIALSPWIPYSTLLSLRAYSTEPAWPSMARQRSRANARAISPVRPCNANSPLYLPCMDVLAVHPGLWIRYARPLHLLNVSPPRLSSRPRLARVAKQGLAMDKRVMECRDGLLKI